MIIVTQQQIQAFPVHQLIDTVADNAIYKDCSYLTDHITPLGANVKLYNYKNNSNILGIVNHKIIFVISLVPFTQSRLFNMNAVQIFRTFVHPDYRRQGITISAYQALVNETTCLVCSEYQTTFMLGVWKKIALNSPSSLFEINIIDSNHTFTDIDGNIIQYDTINIPDADLWCTLPDRDKADVFMVLKKKNISQLI